jgi:hypothetical protein
MPEESRPARVAVLEASNKTLGEHYFFLSPLPLHAVIREHCDRPPEPIGHWRKGQDIRYREIETDIDADGARVFLMKYVQFVRRTGVKVCGE